MNCRDANLKKTKNWEIDNFNFLTQKKTLSKVKLADTTTKKHQIFQLFPGRSLKSTKIKKLTLHAPLCITEI